MTKHTAPKVLPTFASEDEERRFWDEHDPSEYFTEPADAVVVRPRAGTVAVRIDEALHGELRAAAARRGETYERLLSDLLRQGLGSLTHKQAPAGKT